MIDIIANFKLTFLLGGLVAAAYAFFSVMHSREPYSRRVKDDLGATLLGFGVEAAFWFALMFLGAILIKWNTNVWRTVLLVIETPLLPVSLVEISTVVIPICFTVNKDSDGHYDYRVWAILGVGLLAFLFGLYYWSTLSVTP